jgi:plastocyanin domain-containing protein
MLPLLVASLACDKAPDQPTSALTAAPQPIHQPSHSATPVPRHIVHVKATDKGFEPAEVKLTQGVPSAIEFERLTEMECLRAVRMPWMREATDLPVGERVVIPIPTDKSGRFVYACWMNMIFGRVHVEARK